MFEFNDFDFLWHEKLADGLWRIVEDFGGPQKICMYVVEGKDKTAVIDSGLGVTHSLRKYIETHITTKTPMINLMTHSHPDHIGGCTLFDEQYVHPDELPQLAWGLDDKRRINDAAAFAFTGLPGSKVHADLDRALAVGEYCKKNYIPVDYHSIDWKVVNDGDVIDLGGIKLECIYMNCHGSMMYYNQEQDYCLCGDNLTYTLAVGDVDEELVTKYERFAGKIGDRTMLYNGHLYYEDNVTRPKEIDAPMLRELIQALKDILAGVGFENDQKNELFIVPGAPTLMGYKPDEDASQEVWDAFHAQHPERKGKTPKTGESYVRMVGPIIVTYKR